METQSRPSLERVRTEDIAADKRGLELRGLGERPSAHNESTTKRQKRPSGGGDEAAPPPMQVTPLTLPQAPAFRRVPTSEVVEDAARVFSPTECRNIIKWAEGCVQEFWCTTSRPSPSPIPINAKQLAELTSPEKVSELGTNPPPQPYPNPSPYLTPTCNTRRLSP
jgi:hypothetical protein